MKKIFLILFFLGTKQFAFAQNWYENAMAANIAIADSAINPERLENSARVFQRIYRSRKNDWAPLFYYTLCITRKAYGMPYNKKSEADKLEALSNVKQLDSLYPEFVENVLLECFIQLAFLDTDTSSLGISLLLEKLHKAEQREPLNPRVYLLKAIMLDKVGGAKEEEIMDLLIISKEKFNNAVDNKKFHPNWGKIELQQLQVKYQK